MNAMTKKPIREDLPQCDWIKPNGQRCLLYARFKFETGGRFCNYHTPAWEALKMKRFPNGWVKIEDGMELFRVPEGTDVWFETLAPPEYGFIAHINPKPEDIQPGWSREWPSSPH